MGEIKERADHFPTLLRVSLEHAEVVFTTRVGGVSEPPYDSLNLGAESADDPADLVANRDRLRVATGLEHLAWNRQVHGTRINAVVAASAGKREGDGLVTDAPGLGLLVIAADCLPIALASTRRVAMLHCGWRGLADGLIAASEPLFADEEGQIEAVIGPGICRDCFLVGEDVIDRFRGADPQVVGDGNVDLKLAAKLRLERAGVSRIHDVDECTACTPDRFFSHRRDGGATGRQAGVVWRSTRR